MDGVSDSERLLVRTIFQLLYLSRRHFERNSQLISTTRKIGNTTDLHPYISELVNVVDSIQKDVSSFTTLSGDELSFYRELQECSRHMSILVQIGKPIEASDGYEIESIMSNFLGLIHGMQPLTILPYLRYLTGISTFQPQRSYITNSRIFGVAAYYYSNVSPEILDEIGVNTIGSESFYGEKSYTVDPFGAGASSLDGVSSRMVNGSLVNAVNFISYQNFLTVSQITNADVGSNTLRSENSLSNVDSANEASSQRKNSAFLKGPPQVLLKQRKSNNTVEAEMKSLLGSPTSSVISDGISHLSLADSSKVLMPTSSSSQQTVASSSVSGSAVSAVSRLRSRLTTMNEIGFLPHLPVNRVTRDVSEASSFVRKASVKNMKTLPSLNQSMDLTPAALLKRVQDECQSCSSRPPRDDFPPIIARFSFPNDFITFRGMFTSHYRCIPLVGAFHFIPDSLKAFVNAANFDNISHTVPGADTVYIPYSEVAEAFDGESSSKLDEDTNFGWSMPSVLTFTIVPYPKSRNLERMLASCVCDSLRSRLSVTKIKELLSNFLTEQCGVITVPGVYYHNPKLLETSNMPESVACVISVCANYILSTKLTYRERYLLYQSFHKAISSSSQSVTAVRFSSFNVEIPTSFSGVDNIFLSQSASLTLSYEQLVRDFIQVDFLSVIYAILYGLRSDDVQHFLIAFSWYALTTLAESRKREGVDILFVLRKTASTYSDYFPPSHYNQDFIGMDFMVLLLLMCYDYGITRFSDKV